ncbi:hypothetical protein [Hoeflea sp.]|uniref:hypothetical protein n=1 Tax=Hoeflea sp. TaxID=1940281 RepID=UPI003B027655
MQLTHNRGNGFPFNEGGRPHREQARVPRLSVHHSDFTLRGFSPQPSLGREDRRSDARPHDHARTFAETGFVRRF